MTADRHAAGFRVAAITAGPVLLGGARRDAWTDCYPPVSQSAGVGGKRGEATGGSVGKLMKGLALSEGVAADLAVIEGQGQGAGQKPDCRQHDEVGSPVDRGVFEMIVGDDGLNDFGIDSPAAATEKVDE